MLLSCARCCRNLSSASFHNLLMLAYLSTIARADGPLTIEQSLFVGNLAAGKVAFCTTKISPKILPLVLGPSLLSTCGIIGIVVHRLLPAFSRFSSDKTTAALLCFMGIANASVIAKARASSAKAWHCTCRANLLHVKACLPPLRSPCLQPNGHVTVAAPSAGAKIGAPGIVIEPVRRLLNCILYAYEFMINCWL